MQNFLYIFIVILLAFISYLLFVNLKNKNNKNLNNEEENKREETALKLLLEQMNDLSRQMREQTRVVDNKISESSRHMQDSMKTQLSESNKIIREVTVGLTRLDETNKQVVSFTEELQNLQDMLKNPKQRGILGEYYLETLLKNILPPNSFSMQYNLGKDKDTGQDLIPDAVVFVKDKIIPVDSKFSLENYNKLTTTKDLVEKERIEKLFVSDLKNRIVETSKYIKPEYGTMDFAFMFIPHEAIYYDLLINKVGALQNEDTESLIERAAGKYKVIIVSPTSFLAYLQTVLQGLRALQIEESAKEIKKHVENLGKHLESYATYHEKLGNSISTVVNHFNSSSKEFKKIDKDILKISETGGNFEVTLLDKPSEE